jgi:hypothetical protein
MFGSLYPRRRRLALTLEPLEERQLLSSSAFTVAMYNTLLHRNPSPGEVTGWVRALDGGLSPFQMATAFTTSPEFRANLVRFDYQALLHREPSALEIGAWVGALQAGVSEEAVEASFLGSNEFFLNQGGTGAGWITGAFQQVLGQTPDSTILTSTLTLNVVNPFFRQQVAFNLVRSTAAHVRMVTTDFGLMLFRNPDFGGLATSVGLLDGGLAPSTLLASIASSTEFIELTSQGGLDGRPFPTFIRSTTLVGLTGPAISVVNTNPLFVTPLVGGAGGFTVQSVSSVTFTPPVGILIPPNPLISPALTFNPILGTSFSGIPLFQGVVIDAAPPDQGGVVDSNPFV